MEVLAGWCANPQKVSHFSYFLFKYCPMKLLFFLNTEPLSIRLRNKKKRNNKNDDYIF